MSHPVAKSRQDAITLGLKRYWGECRHHGKVVRWVSNYSCTECVTQQVIGYRERNAPMLVDKRREWGHQNPVKSMLQRASQRARRLGIDFDLLPSDICIPDVCPILGIPLTRLGLVDSAPSLDRINPSLGYVRGNVAVISHRANRIKNDASVAELRAVLNYMETHI